MKVGTAEAGEAWRGEPADGQWEWPPVQAWPGWKGRGLWDRARQMPSAPRGPLKSLCCQAGQGVCRSLLPPLQTPPATAWAACPGYELLLHGLLHTSLYLSSQVYFSLPPFSSFFLCLSFSLPFFLSLSLPPSPTMFFLFPSVIISHSFLYLSTFLYLPFSFSVSFLVLLISVSCYSFSLPLSFSILLLSVSCPHC